ncbi:MAG: tetratricopeptide repeat protein [Flavobacteriales bacterium]|nr:tetratricopeptide repeat protein [Flavobacteriales bacterium]
MKKNGLLFAMLIAGTIAFAQPDVTSAYNANKSGEYDVAVNYIEKAITDPKASAKEKVWRYRGAIYLNVASSPKYAAMFPNAIQLSKESFFKAIELDKAGDYKNENMMSLNSLQGLILENASNSYKSNDFCAAAQHFIGANEISIKFGIVDSAAIFNAAFCNDKCGKLDEAIEGYKQSAAINYNVPDVYMYIAELYTKQGKTEEAKKVISEARAKYPKDVELLRSEVNVLLGEQKYDQALAQLEALTAADPKNETIWFVLGATYEKLGKVADQERAYNKALEINPNYYDALFNLAATHYNKGVEQMKECDKIPMRETAKFDQCKADAGKHFQTSIGFFERAYEQKPEEQEIISALAEAYLRVENQAGYDKMKAKMKK